VIYVAVDEGAFARYYISMAEIPKLLPEVEIPRPRSSGAAVVAVAALAMFTAVGASAFVVRVRMGTHSMGWSRCENSPVRVASARAQAYELRDAFLTAVGRRDDETALEIYRSMPPGADPTGELAGLRAMIVEREIAMLENELVAGDCAALHNHIDWFKRVAPEEGISVRASECPLHAIEVKLVDAP
jgi:hypothetical protein